MGGSCIGVLLVPVTWRGLRVPVVSDPGGYTEVRQINPEIRFILASGYLEQVQKSAIFELGAKDILQKPYEFDKMLKSVREVIDAKKL